MSVRELFTVVKSPKDSKKGGMNEAVFLVTHENKPGKFYIEKRVARAQIEDGYGDCEVKALYRFRDCPYIVTYKIHDFTNYKQLGYGSMYMPRCELGSLDSLIRRFDNRRQVLLDEGFLYKVSFDISIALAQMRTGLPFAGTGFDNSAFDTSSRVPSTSRPSSVFGTSALASGTKPRASTRSNERVASVEIGHRASYHLHVKVKRSTEQN